MEQHPAVAGARHLRSGDGPVPGCPAGACRSSRAASRLRLPGLLRGSPAQRRRECGGQLYQSLGIERGDEAAKLTQLLRNFELFDAPHVAVVTTEAGLGVYGAVDAGLYLGTFLLAAQSRGVATAAQAAIAAYSPFVREHFGIPDGRRMVAGISFGYAAESPVNGFRTTRAEIDEVVTWVDG